MKISIGILAYNEASKIEQTLASLFRQTLFQPVHPQKFNIDWIQIVVVPNGCSDATEQIAHSFFEQLETNLMVPIAYEVRAIAQAGKSNAWNSYIHDFSDQDAKYLFLMDADIQLVQAETMSLMLSTLETTPEAWVATDTPVKDVALKQQKNYLEKLSLQASSTGDGRICGQLYCGRSAVLRKIWMPVGLSVEDGFLNAMLTTNYFTCPTIPTRVKCTENAYHIFEAYTSIPALLRHERRIVIGSIFNFWLFEDLWSICHPQADAASVLEQRYQTNPLWFKAFLEDRVAARGWVVIPSSMLFRRFKQLQQHTLKSKFVRLPFSVVAFMADFVVFTQANFEIKFRSRFGYW
ncbi:MAG: glycosyltransferase [Aphanocapsa sp. GSE-SYN-MK-11-07L]|nr:glycosyltransferase [Aphanocapsa sp. GSE-SYN-MK-11-07L]